MQGKPAVSVVIPLFNKGPYIARALNSVLDQTFKDFEIIVVDDGSTDDGAAFVREIANPRILLIQQENQGVSAARNRGIEAARAELVAFLDADDEWMPDHLETVVKLRKMYPEAGVYTTAYFVRCPDSGLKTPKYYAIPKKPWHGLIPNYFQSAAYGDSPVSTTVVVIPKIVLIEMGGFNISAFWGEDTDLWGRISFKYPIAFSWEGLGVYHTEATNRLCNRTEPITEHVFIKTAKNKIKNGEIKPSLIKYLLIYMDKKKIETAWYNYRANRADIARKNIKGPFTNEMKLLKYWTLIWTFIPIKVFYLMSRLKRRLSCIRCGFHC